MCLKIKFYTHHRVWVFLFLLKSQNHCTLLDRHSGIYIYCLQLSPPSHTCKMYSVEPSLRRLNCTELETGQRRKAPSPHVLSLSIPSSMGLHTRALLVSKDRQHLFVTPSFRCNMSRLFLRRCNKLFHGVEKCSTEQVTEVREIDGGTTELDVVDGLSSDREFRDLHEIRKSCEEIPMKLNVFFCRW